MMLYHLKRAISTILKFRSHTAFSLTGLIIGLACVFIISAWVTQELLFDRFHHHADHVYMLTTDIKDNTGNMSRFPETPGPLAEALEKQIPQIETGFHFLYLYGGRTIENNSSKYKEQGIAATPEFLEVFNFRLISGKVSELDEPNTIFLSRGLADKLFPGGDPVGQELLYKEKQVLVVKGIFRDVPFNSSIQFDFLIPYAIEYGISDEWWQLSDATFMRISASADMKKVYQLMKETWREKITDDQYNIGMIPITDLRYGADFEFFNAEHGHGNRKQLLLFVGVAILILVLACLNYMNLISAYAVKREKEVWIRKIHGASGRDITNYYIVDSILLSVLAWGLASLLAITGLRIFEHQMNIVISRAYFKLAIGIGFFIAITVVGLATGIYPAVRAGSLLLAQSRGTVGANFILMRNLRNAFVLSQFILSIALTISSLIIIRQAHFMMNFDTGYSKQDIVEYFHPDNSNWNMDVIRDYLNSNPDVETYSVAGSSPVVLTMLNTMEKWSWEGLEEGAHTSFYHIGVDEDYLNVFGIHLKAGKFFSSPGTDQNRVVINEKLAGLTGFESPVGHLVRNGENAFEIIGIVKDFNFQHLSNEIRPLLFTCGGTGRRLFIKIKPGSEGTVNRVREQLSGLSGRQTDFEYITEEYDRLYKGEHQISSAILFFTLLTILLSSLGLIGMVTYGAEARARDTAIRKVFGAENSRLMINLNLGIFRLFLIGLLSGSLIAWLVMREWLEGYSYRTGLEVWIFLLGAFIILVFSLLSVSIQTWKAVRQSPAVTLRNQ
jgi:putative ABC transport system permease protein